MARLLIRYGGAPVQPLELKLGVNRLGRSDDNDFQIDHPTVSAMHCEILLADSSVTIRDLGSSNGTFLNGRQIEEAKLEAGQVMHLGEVEMLVETTEVTIAIPKFDIEQPPSSVRLPDGSLSCVNHLARHAVGQCTQCKKVFCESCIHDLHRAGGKHLRLCPVCGGRCVALSGARRKKKSLFARLRETLKLPLER